MSMQLLKKIRQTIDQYRMLDIGDGVVVAVSGGPDSVALLAILMHLSAEYRLKLVVAHLNHGLRPGPADEEEAFVHRLSERLGLICAGREKSPLKKPPGRKDIVFLKKSGINIRPGKLLWVTMPGIRRKPFS
jgi:tRNA(Ile)-lysidine synthase TilS/MesJ